MKMMFGLFCIKFSRGCMQEISNVPTIVNQIKFFISALVFIMERKIIEISNLLNRDLISGDS
jgi:hypothetical protein